MKPKEKQRENFELFGCDVWAKIQEKNGQWADSVSHQKMADAMRKFSVNHLQGELEIKAKQGVAIEAAYLLESLGHKELAIKLLEENAALRVLSLAGPCSHRVKTTANREIAKSKNNMPSSWAKDISIEMAKSIMKRNFGRQHHVIAKQIVKHLESSERDVPDGCSIPKSDTVARWIKPTVESFREKF